MAKIKIDIDQVTIKDGSELVFIAPCNCSEVDGLNIHHFDDDNYEVISSFIFRDAHNNKLTDVNAFEKNAYVKVILNTMDKVAYIQNADTNQYLEGKFNNLLKEHTWENIPDKPFGIVNIGDTIVSDDVIYDGYHLVAECTPISMMRATGVGVMNFYRVENNVLGEIRSTEVPYGSDLKIYENENGFFIAWEGLPYVVFSYNGDPKFGAVTFNGITKPGVYFRQDNNIVVHSMTLTDYSGFETVLKVPEECIPIEAIVETLKESGDFNGGTVELPDNVLAGTRNGDPGNRRITLDGFNDSDNEIPLLSGGLIRVWHLPDANAETKGAMSPEQYTKLEGIAEGATKVEKPEDIGAEASGTTSKHNTSDSAHSDIRLLLQELSTKVSNFLDTDEETMNELSELITAIGNNADTITALTTGKVNVSDIVNDLVTNVTNKPISAAQGVVLKKLYDDLDTAIKAIKVLTKLSELTGDSTHRTVTDAEKQTWNNKQPAGDYVTKTELALEGFAKQSDVNILMHSWLLNGTETVLTVGKDIQVGQVIKVYYLLVDGYKYVKYTAEPFAMSTYTKPKVTGVPAYKYGCELMAIEDYDTYTFTGAYSEMPTALVDQVEQNVANTAQLSEEIVNLKSNGIVIVQDGNTLTIDSGGDE